MRNLAIIPARSGSKGLPDKNIKLLQGKPLIAYSIEAARESKMFEKVMVSTDSEKYAHIACEFGAEVPFLRSEKNSGDTATSVDMLQEVLYMYNELGDQFDTVCLLQPTSPLRMPGDIVRAYDLLKEKAAEAVTSVCEVEHTPKWTMALPESLSMKTFREKSRIDALRQELGTFYRLNGAIYIYSVVYDGNVVTLKRDDEYAFIMEQNRSVDIDTELDFFMAECMMQYLKKSNDSK